jgi:MFS family permease
MNAEHKPPLLKWAFGGMFLLLGMAPGFYTPVISVVLAEQGLGSEWVERTFLGGSLAGMITPLMICALADNRFASQKVYGTISILSGCFLALAFGLLGGGASPWWFVCLFFTSKLSGGAMWSLLASLSMSNLGNLSREFPLIRLGATLGWMAAGWILSWVLAADDSVLCGYMAAAVRIGGGLLAFLLPDTPAAGESRSWQTLLGLDAFKLLGERDQRAFFIAAGLLAIPTAAFHMYAPLHLRELGVERVAAAMSMSQATEIVTMVGMAAFLGRFRIKAVVLGALALLVLRYVLFAAAGWSGGAVWMVAGIGAHGLAYTVFVITSQIFLHRRVATEMRSQAQGMLTLLRGGIGSLIGVVAVRHLNDWALASGAGWSVYWAMLAVATLAIAVGFGLSFRGSPVGQQGGPGE